MLLLAPVQLDMLVNSVAKELLRFLHLLDFRHPYLINIKQLHSELIFHNQLKGRSSQYSGLPLVFVAKI
jgi:hypothetical protein